MRSLVSRMLFDWTMWRLKRKLLRLSPTIRAIDAEERAARKAHGRTRELAAARSRIVHQQLAREVGRA